MSEILTIKEPSIKINPISESYDDDNRYLPSSDKTIGGFSPYIKINSTRLDSSRIESFRLSCSGFIPTLYFTYNDNSEYIDSDPPKDGDLVELYIRSSNNEKIKKIRANFDVLKVDTQVLSTGISYSFQCILNVPNLFSDISQSYEKNTSFNHLIKVCDLLGLGFASNITSTNDSMNRFNAKNNINSFINSIIDSSYINDNSFLTGFIDLWYYLNFVEVNSTIKTESQIKEVEVDLARFIGQDKDVTSESVKAPELLTNHPRFEVAVNHIKKFSVFNNSGNVWMTHGYKRYVEYVDLLDSYKSFFIEPLTNESSTYIKLRGKSGTDLYKSQVKKKYLGRTYLNQDNLHINYHYAKILNAQNLYELNKMGMRISLKGISSSITRFRLLPVTIFRTGFAKVKRIASDELTSKSHSQDDLINHSDLMEDSFLSGWYLVKDFDIVWSKREGFEQIVNLVRREWPEPYKAGTAIKND